MNDYDYADDNFEDEEEEIEAYCVSCKMKVEMEKPVAVWTRRGTPGTRGECPMCGSTIFRMGKTDAHQSTVKPSLSTRPEQAKAPGSKRGSSMLAYLNYHESDEAIARQIAADLEKMGIPAWVDFNENADEVNWASGVHPAIEECSHMVIVLSPESVEEGSLQENWQHFQDRKKPVVVAQVGEIEVPDDLRRRPRYDFKADYKSAFRQMLQQISS